MEPGPSELEDYRSWRDEHRVEVLLLNPLIQNRIARHTRGSRREPSAVSTLKDAFSKGDAAGFIFGTSLAGSLFLQRRRRMARGPERAEQLPWPIGSTIVAVLVSFADRDQRLVDIEQGEAGCTLAAEIDFSNFSIPGLITAGVTKSANGSTLEAEVQLPGGPIDFGKRKRILNTFFNDVPRFAALDTHL
jgi:hypothetical protein